MPVRDSDLPAAFNGSSHIFNSFGQPVRFASLRTSEVSSAAPVEPVEAFSTSPRSLQIEARINDAVISKIKSALDRLERACSDRSAGKNGNASPSRSLDKPIATIAKRRNSLNKSRQSLSSPELRLPDTEYARRLLRGRPIETLFRLTQSSRLLSVLPGEPSDTQEPPRDAARTGPGEHVKKSVQHPSTKTDKAQSNTKSTAPHIADRKAVSKAVPRSKPVELDIDFDKAKPSLLKTRPGSSANDAPRKSKSTTERTQRRSAEHRGIKSTSAPAHTKSLHPDAQKSAKRSDYRHSKRDSNDGLKPAKGKRASAPHNETVNVNVARGPSRGVSARPAKDAMDIDGAKASPMDTDERKDNDRLGKADGHRADPRRIKDEKVSSDTRPKKSKKSSKRPKSRSPGKVAKLGISKKEEKSVLLRLKLKKPEHLRLEELEDETSPKKPRKLKKTRPVSKSNSGNKRRAHGKSFADDDRLGWTAEEVLDGEDADGKRIEPSNVASRSRSEPQELDDIDRRGSAKAKHNARSVRWEDPEEDDQRVKHGKSKSDALLSKRTTGSRDDSPYGTRRRLVHSSKSGADRDDGREGKLGRANRKTRKHENRSRAILKDSEDDEDEVPVKSSKRRSDRKKLTSDDESDSTPPPKAEKKRASDAKRSARRATARGSSAVNMSDLTILPGSRPPQTKKFNYSASQQASRERMLRVSSQSIEIVETEVEPPTRTLLDLIMQFKITSAMPKGFLNNKMYYCDGLFTLAFVPGCVEFGKVAVTHYLRKLTSSHKRYLEAMLKHEAEPEYVAQNFDENVCDVDENRWKEKFERSPISQDGENSVMVNGQVCPPFVPKTKDLLQFLVKVLTKFAGSDEEVCKTFFKELYDEPASKNGPSTIDIFGRTALCILKIWNKFQEKSELKNKRSILFEAAVKLISKLFTFELRRPCGFPTGVETGLFMSVLKGNEPLSLREMFQICVAYFNSDSERRRESTPVVEMFHLYASSVLGTVKKQEGLDALCDDEKNGDILDNLCSADFWNLFVQTPLQSTLRAESKIYETHELFAFIVAIVRNPRTCREAFKAQEKTGELIINVSMRALKELSRDPLSVFRDLWDYKREAGDAATCVDLIKQLLTYGFVLKELFSSSDARRNEFFDSIQALVTKATILRLETVGRDCIDKWWKFGPFSRKIVTLVDEMEPIRILKSEHDRLARCYGFASMARIIGSLGVSFDDGSRDLRKPNPINCFLQQKANGTRSALQILEELLTIQVHLEKSVEVSKSVSHVDTSSRDKKHARHAEKGEGERKMKIALLSNEDCGNFSHVLEAVRIHVRKLKNLATSFDGRVEDRKSGLVIKQSLVKPSKPCLPNVITLPGVQAAVASQEGYLDLENDIRFMKSIAAFGRSQAREILARFEDSPDLRIRWTRLKRNYYVNEAKDHLTREDKAVGQMCTCLAARVGEKKDKAGKIGCANEMCENRMAKTECGPGPCGAGDYCRNRRLQNLEYAKTRRTEMKGKGLGLVASGPIAEGELIGEYQGEIISMEEYEKRKKEYAGERHFYFMTLTNKLVIDASRKSQITRFVNHSCDPNCVAEKWNAGGYPRVAIIAKQPIQKDEEITFDYGARAIGNDSAPCLCGSANCRGNLTSRKQTSKDVEMKPSSLDKDAKPETVVEDPLKIVKEKTEKARRRVERCDELRASIEGKVDLVKEMMNDNKELVLDDNQKRKVEEWKQSLSKKSEPTKGRRREENKEDDPTRMHDPNAFDIRIPRFNPSEKVDDEHAKAAGSSSFGNTTRQGRDSRFQPANQVPNQSRMYPRNHFNDLSRRNIPPAAPRQTYRHGIAPGCAPSLLPQPPSQNQRPHIGPMEDTPGSRPQQRRSVFQPTCMKSELERMNRRPPIARKAEDLNRDDDSDVSSSWSRVSDTPSVGSDYEVAPCHLRYKQNIIAWKMRLAKDKKEAKRRTAEENSGVMDSLILDRKSGVRDVSRRSQPLQDGNRMSQRLASNSQAGRTDRVKKNDHVDNVYSRMLMRASEAKKPTRSVNPTDGTLVATKPDTSKITRHFQPQAPKRDVHRSGVDERNDRQGIPRSSFTGPSDQLQQSSRARFTDFEPKQLPSNQHPEPRKDDNSRHRAHPLIPRSHPNPSVANSNPESRTAVDMGKKIEMQARPVTVSQQPSHPEKKPIPGQLTSISGQPNPPPQSNAKREATVKLEQLVARVQPNNATSQPSSMMIRSVRPESLVKPVSQPVDHSTKPLALSGNGDTKNAVGPRKTVLRSSLPSVGKNDSANVSLPKSATENSKEAPKPSTGAQQPGSSTKPNPLPESTVLRSEHVSQKENTGSEDKTSTPAIQKSSQSLTKASEPSNKDVPGLMSKLGLKSVQAPSANMKTLSNGKKEPDVKHVAVRSQTVSKQSEDKVQPTPKPSTSGANPSESQSGPQSRFEDSKATEKAKTVQREPPRRPPLVRFEVLSKKQTGSDAKPVFAIKSTGSTETQKSRTAIAAKPAKADTKESEPIKAGGEQEGSREPQETAKEDCPPPSKREVMEKLRASNGVENAVPNRERKTDEIRKPLDGMRRERGQDHVLNRGPERARGDEAGRKERSRDQAIGRPLERLRGDDVMKERGLGQSAPREREPVRADEGRRENPRGDGVRRERSRDRSARGLERGFLDDGKVERGPERMREPLNERELPREMKNPRLRNPDHGPGLGFQYRRNVRGGHERALAGSNAEIPRDGPRPRALRDLTERGDRRANERMLPALPAEAGPEPPRERGRLRMQRDLLDRGDRRIGDRALAPRREQLMPLKRPRDDNLDDGMVGRDRDAYLSEMEERRAFEGERGRHRGERRRLSGPPIRGQSRDRTQGRRLSDQGERRESWLDAPSAGSSGLTGPSVSGHPSAAAPPPPHPQPMGPPPPPGPHMYQQAPPRGHPSSHQHLARHHHAGLPLPHQQYQDHPTYPGPLRAPRHPPGGGMRGPGPEFGSGFRSRGGEGRPHEGMSRKRARYEVQGPPRR